MNSKKRNGAQRLCNVVRAVGHAHVRVRPGRSRHLWLRLQPRPAGSNGRRRVDATGAAVGYALIKAQQAAQQQATQTQLAPPSP